jgi:MFS family permease
MVPSLYRRVLALPGVARTMLMMFIIGLPLTAAGVTMTLHVLHDLGRGYAEAGLVGAAVTIGTGIGSPLIGKMLDRYGLRPVAACCGIGSTMLWCALPFVPYEALLAMVLPAAVLSLPVGSLSRQFLTTLVPQDLRRPAFTLNTILVELSFIVGPAVSVLVIGAYSPTLALLGIGVWRGLNCLAVYIANWPIRTREEKAQEAVASSPPQSWLRGPFVGALLISMGALFVLNGTEMAVIATLRAHDRVELIGLVMGGMAIASIVGGVIYGALHRSWSQGALALWLGLLLAPVGLLADSLWLLLPALIPMNLFCTPALAASSETVARLAPSQVRGLAMGLQDAAIRLGQALGGIVTGFAIDYASPAWGFFAAGMGGVCLTALGYAFTKWRASGPDATSVA